ncbi:MAG: PHP domain-containing protein, partial [Verrucomicrobiales bacterium]|nr:PHP domain-containing protein [Verrucomicrobiales bacterium]
MSDSFVHLHLHTEYSLLDGAVRIGDLMSKALRCKMPAVAMTDHGNLYGAIDFYKQATKAGIKPIIGCEVYLAPGSMHDKKKVPGLPNAHHLTLLA